MSIDHALKQLGTGQTLSEQEAFDVQVAILNGEVATAELLTLFSALEGRAISAYELHGFFRASSQAMAVLRTDRETLDTCGTGGDGSGSFNISTVSSLLCATAKVPVAKHGNRAASSECGSADVLEALGVKIELSPEQASKVLEQTGFVFLFARSYHPAFKYAGEARKAFGKKTYFNFLGPLLNPAHARFRVHGLSDFSLAETLGSVLIGSGVKKAWLVHADDGLDEVSPSSGTDVLEISSEGKRRFRIDPKEYGIICTGNEGLVGGDVQVNAGIISAILQGKGTPVQNAVTILNTASGLTVYGKTKTFEEGVWLAKELIASGAGFEKLQEIKRVSNEV